MRVGSPLLREQWTSAQQGHFCMVQNTSAVQFVSMQDPRVQNDISSNTMGVESQADHEGPAKGGLRPSS